MDKAKMSYEELEKKLKELEAENARLSQAAFIDKLHPESEAEQFKLFVDNAPEPIFIQVDYKFVYANHAGLALYGANSMNQIIGAPIISFIHPDFADVVKEKIKILIESKLPVTNIEYKHRKLDGTDIDAVVSAIPIKYEQKDGALVFIKDITERKKYEARITGLSNIIKNAINEIYVFDTETLQFQFLNKSALNNLGYNLNEILHLTPVDIKPLYSYEAFNAEIESLRNGTQDLLKFETLHKRENGTVYPVEVNLQITQYEGKKCFVAIITDITERKKNEDELKLRTDALILKNMELEASQEEIRATNEELVSTSHALKQSFTELQQAKAILEENELNLLEAQRISKIGNWQLDVTTNTMSWSKACFWLFEIDETKIAPRDLHAEFRKCILPEDLERINKIQAEARQNQEGISYEFKANIKNNIKSFHIIAEPVFDASKALVAYKGTIQDITEDMLFEEKLKNSYDLLNNLAAQVPGVVYQYRLYPDGRSTFPYSSPGMYDIYEVTSEEVREDAAPVFLRLHPDDLESISESIFESARNQTIYQSDFRVILPKQGLRWRHCDAKPQLLDDGSTLWHGIILDITEKKQAEEKLKEQQSLFETIFNTITDAVIITDKERKITLANNGLQTIFGYSPIEIIGKSTEILYADKDFFIKTGKEVFNEQSLNSENFYFTKYINKNGVEFPGETFGAKLYNANGEWIGNLAVMRNISERIRYIEELKVARENAEKSEELKSELLDKLKEAQQIGKIGSWDWNLQTGEVWWSDELYKIFELDPQTYTPSVEKNGKFIHPEDSDSYQSAATRCIQTGEFLNFELRIITPTGQIKNCRSTAKVFFDNEHRATRMSGTFIDITEQILIKTELIKAKEKAEESDRLKTAFLNNISHEIRTPMNAIVGFSGFLNDPDLNPLKRVHFTDMVIQSSNQLLSIITDIISIATIEAGQEKIFEMEIKLNATFKFLYAHFIAIAEKKNVALRFETGLSDDDDKIITDKSKLEAILTNLIGNALKFTQNGQVTFGYRIIESVIEFYIQDTGIGVAPEMHEEIFKRFRQVEVTANRKFGGSGLGLSISKAYTELLGGKIWLTSELGKGTTFYFTIPHIKPAPFIPAPPTKEMQLSSDQPINLLIAEDEESNFILLEEMLSGENVKIVRAYNGLEAVNICKANPSINMILMDIKMPEMDGLEATRQIKAFRPELPIVAQTAYSFPEEKNQAFVAGCDLFLAKPIRKQELLYAIYHVVK